MTDPAVTWQPTIARRLTVVVAVFAAWFVGVEARLVFLQVVDHNRLQRYADDQQEATTVLPAKRGDIVDRHGRLLAYSVDADTIAAVPSQVEAPATAAQRLCEALADCSARDQTQLATRLRTSRYFTYIRRHATPEQTRRVAALELKGIRFMKESRRFYPNRELAAHLLGFVGLDNAGLAGLEATYDKVVRGKDGKLVSLEDARQRSFTGRLEHAPTAGGSLELTIDEQIQHIVERELEAGVREKNADAGSAVVLDPHTGEILAMASWPTFNPNQFGLASAEARRNRPVQDGFEPGSTFKTVTIAAALEEHLMTPDFEIDTAPGIYRIGSRVIDEFEGHNYGRLSLTDVIVKSSNVGAIKIGVALGAERFGLYAQRFGFGRPTSVDFPSESAGILWPPDKLDESGLASMSMGYQVSVTPLQMAAAMAAIANGGTWIEPRVVRAVIRDGVRTPMPPARTRRVISSETAQQMLPILEKVVTDGTAKLAQLPAYQVAGKTGTADKIVNKRYVGHEQNVSFLGFVPARRPVLTAIVMIDTPRVGSDTGGAVAAPIFRRIADRSLRILGVPSDLAPLPPVLVTRNHPAPNAASSRPASVQRPQNNDPTLLGVSDPHSMPDLTGYGLREAVRLLTDRGLRVRVRGTGTVVDQSLAPGSPLEPGTTCTLTLQRLAPRSTATGVEP